MQTRELRRADLATCIAKKKHSDSLVRNELKRTIVANANAEKSETDHANKAKFLRIFAFRNRKIVRIPSELRDNFCTFMEHLIPMRKLYLTCTRNE